MKKFQKLYPIFLLGALSACTNPQAKNENNVKETTAANESITSDVSDKIPEDDFVGSWVDITLDSADASETITIKKLHDTEYQIGDLTANLKETIEGKKYLSAWSQEYSVETQVIFDNYTSHIMIRTPMFKKEYRKISN